MGSAILDIATSALRVTQRALDTTGHNIANVNTEGYSRQRVETATRYPHFTGAGFFGTGVETTAIKRVYDDFLATRLRNATSGFSTPSTTSPAIPHRYRPGRPCCRRRKTLPAGSSCSIPA